MSLDERYRRLCRRAGRDALKRVGDEVAGTPLRLCGSLFLELTDAPGQLVAYLVLGLLEDSLAGLAPRHLRDPLELSPLAVVRVLEVFLQLLEVDLPIGDTLLSPREVEQPPVRLLLLLDHALLDLHGLVAPPPQLGLELRSYLHRLLSRLDLGLAPCRVRVALGLVEEQRARPPCGLQPGAGREPQTGEDA